MNSTAQRSHTARQQHQPACFGLWFSFLCLSPLQIFLCLDLPIHSHRGYFGDVSFLFLSSESQMSSPKFFLLLSWIHWHYREASNSVAVNQDIVQLLSTGRSISQMESAHTDSVLSTSGGLNSTEESTCEIFKRLSTNRSILILNSFTVFGLVCWWNNKKRLNINKCCATVLFI